MEFPRFVSTLRVFDWSDFDLSIKGDSDWFWRPWISQKKNWNLNYHKLSLCGGGFIQTMFWTIFKTI